MSQSHRRWIGAGPYIRAESVTVDRVFPFGRQRRPASRRGARAVVVALTTALVVGGLLAPAAADREDELENRADHLDGSIDHQHSELEHSSRMLQRATAELRASQVRLDAARDALATTLGKLAVAQQLDEQMRRALAGAERRLAVAEEELAIAESTVADTEDDLERFAVQSYATSDPGLISMDAVLDGDSPLEFTELMSSAESVVAAQTATMDELDAARVLLALRDREVQALRNQVAVKRRLAAENLDLKEALAADAREKRRTVRQLVDERRQAQERSQQARAHDLRILAKMKAERDRVQDLLSELRVERLEEMQALEALQALEAASPGSTGGSGFFDLPVPGAYVTSPYGMRLHPTLNVVKLHDGIDFGAGCGVPILAPADGEVVAQYYNAGYGNRVLVSHGSANGVALATSYNHLSEYATTVGQQVERGDVIGYVGTTGYSTGCHLHFMVYENAATVDPAGWL